jgi:predicted metal-dependent HD superfamily phosphohydrolase
MPASPHDWLHEHWQSLCAALGVEPAAAEPAFAELAARYAHPDRHYHNLAHLRHVLETLDQLKQLAQDLPALLLAAWFHDAVYDARAKDNEAQSALLAQAVLERFRVPKPLSERVAALILLTKSHSAASDDIDGQLLLDADLAILGAGEAEYRQYAAAIRREYAWVAETDYRAGRAAVLKRFEERPVIFHCALMRDQFERSARRNLQAERLALASGMRDG